MVHRLIFCANTRPVSFLSSWLPLVGLGCVLASCSSGGDAASSGGLEPADASVVDGAAKLDGAKESAADTSTESNSDSSTADSFVDDVLQSDSSIGKDSSLIDAASHDSTSQDSASVDSSLKDSSLADSASKDTGAADSSKPDTAAPDVASCLASMASCSSGTACCSGLSCGSTSLGKVCCGMQGASCKTADGADCCGDLLCVDGSCQSGETMFKAPFPCGQKWTYDHHSAEVRLAVDFIRNDGGPTDGAPMLASAEGTATRHYEAGGAGNYIVIQHAGGWKTYYFHMSSFSVADGAHVKQGQEIGKVGTTGGSSGPHIHYEQLLNGVGQLIKINGQSLAPYPSNYYQKSITSDNGCGKGKPFSTWGAKRPVHAKPQLSSPIVATLAGPTLVYVTCQTQGDSVTAEGFTNPWWSKLAEQNGFLSNIYIDDPASKLPGVPDCQ